MGLQNSTIMICRNIKLDKSYKDVLSYSEGQMVSLCQANAIASANNYSFIRGERGYIKTSFSYSDALKCNYMAFQNSDYSNKWFFAFIDDVIYDNDGTARIRYTIDNFSTWYDYWDASSCLVLREHVTDDTIGLHTYPENLEHGSYIINDYSEFGGFEVANAKPVVATTWVPSNTPGLYSSANIHGGTCSGLYYMVFKTNTDAQNYICAMDGFGRGNSIVSIFMIPSFLVNVGTWTTAILHSKKNNDSGGTDNYDYTIEFALLPNTTGAINLSGDKTVSLNSTLNGYTPKNNKLYCSPFNYILMTNNNGGNAEFHYEDFTNNAPTFRITGVASPGCSIKCFPLNYKSFTPSIVSLHPGFNEGLMAGKFPIGSYKNDSFVNWMTQESVNRQFGIVGTIASIGLTVAGAEDNLGGDDSFYGGLFNKQAQYLSERYKHALVAPQASGNTNGSDVSFGFDEMNFGFYKMSIKREYAEAIDSYMTRFGYQVNKVKIPNQIGRPYWNFLQIGPYENIGYSSNINVAVPASAMDEINRIYRNGVTIWHDHSNLGNYSLDNSL